MRGRAHHPTRLPHLAAGAWPLIAACAWSVLVACLHGLSIRFGITPPTVCRFKALTGHPCPTCGGTRSVFEIASGDVASALAMNPLVTLVLLGAPVWLLAARATRGVGRPLPAWVWVASGLVVLANWAWVLRSGV